MKVVLTGASGFIGSVTCRQLAQAGHEVSALIRESSRTDHIDEYVTRFVKGDIESRATWDDLLSDADAVIHNAFDWKALKSGDSSLHFNRNLVASLNALQWSNPRPFVFVSTIAVHHDMRPRWNGRIDEDHPLRPASLYGACKAAIEAHLWAAHFEHDRHTVAIRPCGVYGLDPDLERSYAYGLVRRLLEGEDVAKPGGGKFVHVEDVAAVIVAALDNPDAAGKPINLVDCYARWSDWAQLAAESLSLTVPVEHQSPDQPRNTFSKDLAQSLGVSLDRGHDGIREYLDELITVHPTFRHSHGTEVQQPHQG